MEEERGTSRSKQSESTVWLIYSSSADHNSGWWVTDTQLALQTTACGTTGHVSENWLQLIIYVWEENKAPLILWFLHIFHSGQKQSRPCSRRIIILSNHVKQLMLSTRTWLLSCSCFHSSVRLRTHSGFMIILIITPNTAAAHQLHETILHNLHNSQPLSSTTNKQLDHKNNTRAANLAAAAAKQIKLLDFVVIKH